MKLTDTQLIVLTKAAQRSTMLALPLPANLKGGAAHKVVKPLIEKGLLEEIDANVRAGDTVWRETGSGHGVTLAIIEAGLAAVGIGPESDKKSKPAASQTPAKAPKAATGAKSPKPAKTAASAKKTARTAPAGTTAPTPREKTKQATMIAMLQRKNGATIAEIVAETGWQPHTVRGAFAGALKKKLGLNIVSEKDEKRGRVYRID